jgi:voltage-gated potassium channel
VRASFSVALRWVLCAWRQQGPQVLTALLAAASGSLQVRQRFWALLSALNSLLQHGAGSIFRVADLAAFPRMLLGIGLILMSLGLPLRARIAWAISLLLAFLSAGLAVWFAHRLDAVFITNILLIAALLVYSRRFNHSSLAAGSLFALLGVGSLWFGAGYAPSIRSLHTAFYYTVETMSTVGYGDIVPRTLEARMFTVSMIVLGITVFATTLSVVIGPLVGGSLKRALEGRMQRETRHNHYVIIGASSLAYTLWEELRSRNVPITVVVPPDRISPYPDDADVIVGDATSNEVLQQAGCQRPRLCSPCATMMPKMPLRCSP